MYTCINMYMPLVSTLQFFQITILAINYTIGKSKMSMARGRPGKVDRSGKKKKSNYFKRRFIATNGY